MRRKGILCDVPTHFVEIPVVKIVSHGMLGLSIRETMLRRSKK